MENFVELKIEQDIAYITLNRPKFGNALNLDMVNQLLKVVIACDQNTTLRCVVLTGTGRFFCTGGDVHEFAQYEATRPNFLSELAGILHLSVSKLLRMNKPLLVAVNGTAAGAGMSLSLLGDVVIATEQSMFSPAYSGIGLSPDAGLTWFLPKLIGLRKAQHLLFVKGKLNAQEALAEGLITQVCKPEELTETVQHYVNILANQSTPAIANMRALLLMSEQNTIETQLELEARFIAQISTHDTAKEGISAYVEKRKPNFRV